MPASDQATAFDEAVQTLRQDIVSLVQDIRAQLGPKPIGIGRALPIGQQLEQWVALRMDQQQLGALAAEWAGQVGQQAAWYTLAREATRLEKALAGRGQWDGSDSDFGPAVERGARAVQYAALIRDIGQAGRTQQQAQKVLDQPKAIVTPDTPALDRLALLTQGAGMAPAPDLGGPPDQGLAGLPLALPPTGPVPPPAGALLPPAERRQPLTAAQWGQPVPFGFGG